MVDINKLAKAIEVFQKLAGKKDPKAKVRNRGLVVFPSDHSKVTDDKDHFPINTASQARNALSEAGKYDKVPDWYKGTLSSLKSAIEKAIQKEYPTIQIR